MYNACMFVQMLFKIIVTVHFIIFFLLKCICAMSITKTSFQYSVYFFLFPFIPVLDLQCIYEYLCQLLGQNTNGIEEFCQFDFGYLEHPDISKFFSVKKHIDVPHVPSH